MSDSPQSKTCNTCRALLDFSAFSADKSTIDGRARKCKACQAAYSAKWYAKNAGRVSRLGAERYAANKDAILSAQRARYASDDEARKKKLAKNKTWADKNKNKFVSYAKKYREANKDVSIERCRVWRELNKERHRTLVDRWRKENKAYGAASTAARRAAKKASIAAWADSEFEGLAISEAYDLASLRTAMLGVEYHVDHIVPLRGKTVCGLHCAANLQVIPAIVNLAKSNRTWPGMPT